MFNLSNRSAHRTDGVHPLLVAATMIAMRRYCRIDFGVGKDAVRTDGLQRMFVDSGASKTMDSLHLIQEDGYSHAIDLYPSGYSCVDDMPEEDFAEIRRALDLGAAAVGIELEHGIDWGWDSPHHQIKRFYN